MYSLTLLVAGACTFIVAIQAKCDGGCKHPTKHYEEIGCEPVYAQPGDCCPTHYDCAKFERRAADKCYLKGQVYNQGDTIPSDLTDPDCGAQCFCGKTQWSDIICAQIECPEHFGQQLGPDCYRAYERDSCCPSKTVCPPFDQAYTCVVNGKTYYEGQQFYVPNDKCRRCTCKAGFTGKFEKPFCNDISCGLEMADSKKFSNKCAPLYYGTERCCPIQIQCYTCSSCYFNGGIHVLVDESDRIEKAKTPSTSGKVCTYGSKLLNIGDKVILKRTTEYGAQIDCECRIPPLVTCIEKPRTST